MHEGCTKLTTMDTTRQSLKLTNLHLNTGGNVTLEMNPFLIRSENGNIAITLSEHLNDTNTRCYQICKYTYQAFAVTAIFFPSIVTSR